MRCTGAVNARQAARDARAERIDSRATSIDGAEPRVRLTVVMAGRVRDEHVLPERCVARAAGERAARLSAKAARAQQVARRRPFSDTRAARLL